MVLSDRFSYMYRVLLVAAYLFPCLKGLLIILPCNVQRKRIVNCFVHVGILTGKGKKKFSPNQLPVERQWWGLALNLKKQNDRR